MASYIVYRRSPADPRGGDEILLHDGFGPWAALFGPLWAAWHGLWLATLVLTLALVAVAAIAPILVVALALFAGWHATDLRGWSLARDGYDIDAIVIAPSREEAQLRVARRHEIDDGGVAA